MRATTKKNLEKASPELYRALRAIVDHFDSGLLKMEYTEKFVKEYGMPQFPNLDYARGALGQAEGQF